jgi:hypothetical protein
LVVQANLKSREIPKENKDMNEKNTRTKSRNDAVIRTATSLVLVHGLLDVGAVDVRGGGIHEYEYEWSVGFGVGARRRAR